MTAALHRVTAQHVAGLAAAASMRGNRTVLADTDDGLRYVRPGEVLAPDSGVRRMLLTLTDLREDAATAGMTVPAYVKAHGARVAAELNEVLAAEKGLT